jgi:hypothetical protein
MQHIAEDDRDGVLRKEYRRSRQSQTVHEPVSYQDAEPHQDSTHSHEAKDVPRVVTDPNYRMLQDLPPALSSKLQRCG